MSFKKNITRLCMYLVSLVFCFLKMFQMVQWKNGVVVWSVKNSMMDEIRTSLGLNPTFHSAAKFFFVLFLIALFLNIILLIIELVRRSAIGKKAMQVILNALPLVFFAASAIAYGSGFSTFYGNAHFSYTGDFSALFYVFALLQILNLILYFVRFPDAEA